MQDNVSLCAIVKNSEDTINAFMEWGLSNFPEINLVVDDHNNDNTLEICNFWGMNEKVNVLVHTFDNFSSQWNRSFEMASKDYILYMGVDEIMEELPPNALAKMLSITKKDILAFPRYNLQFNVDNYHTDSYPDYQLRFTHKSNAKMNGKLVDETFDIINKSIHIANNIHIIHFGHIRNERWLLFKGEDRTKFKEDDSCDGKMLELYGNRWFIERNSEFEQNIKLLSNKTIDQIKKYKKYLMGI